MDFSWVFWSQPYFEGRAYVVRGRADSFLLQPLPTSPCASARGK